MLHVSILFDDYEYFLKVVTESQNLNIQESHYSNTLLHIACIYPRKKNIEILLKNNVKTDIKNSYGATAEEISGGQLVINNPFPIVVINQESGSSDKNKSNFSIYLIVLSLLFITGVFFMQLYLNKRKGSSQK